MVADRLTRAVREQLGLGRLLPLGGPADGAWITERAARQALRRAAAAVPDLRLDTLRVGLADPAAVARPSVPPPASALPPGRLRIEATCAAVAGQPLPVLTATLRTALAEAATGGLGLRLDAVDLRVTALLDEPVPPEAEAPPAPGGLPSAAPSPAAPDAPEPPGGPAGPGSPEASSRLGLPEAGRLGGPAAQGRPGAPEAPTETGAGGPAGPGDLGGVSESEGWGGAGEPGGPEAAGGVELPAGAVAAAAAAAAVPGVAALTPVLGGSRQPVRVEDRTAAGGGPGGRHVEVQLAVAAGHRALDVAREVRAAVGRTVSAPGTVSVLVTDVRAGTGETG